MGSVGGALDRGPLSNPWPEAAHGRRSKPTVGGSITGLGFVAGLLAILIGAYQLFGTGILASHAQAHLRKTPIAAHAHLGAPVARLLIPSIHLDVMVVEGVGMKQLAEGPGHYPNTPEPGLGGNVAIAGHRTTHLAPFWSLDTLVPGNPKFIYMPTFAVS